MPQIFVAVGGEQEENATLRAQSEDLSCRLKKSEATVMKLTHDVEQLRACLTLDAHSHPTRPGKENRVQVRRPPKRNTTVDGGIRQTDFGLSNTQSLILVLVGAGWVVSVGTRGGHTPT